MNRWHFKLWHVLLLYGAALTLGSATVWIWMSASLAVTLNILVLLLVSANVFYQARRKNATTQGTSDMSRWHFKLWHVLLLYGAALIIGIIATLPSLSVENLLGGKVAIILAMLIISANLFYRAQKKNAMDAG